MRTHEAQVRPPRPKPVRSVSSGPAGSSTPESLSAATMRMRVVVGRRISFRRCAWRESQGPYDHWQCLLMPPSLALRAMSGARREAPVFTDRGLRVLAPRMRQSTNRRGVAEPQIRFRIIHVAEDGHHRAVSDAMREQSVEIALGPKGVSKKGNAGVVTREVAAHRVVSPLPEPLGKPKPPKKPKTPRVVGLLQMAMDWQRELDAGEVDTQAEIARREGITRARVTQIMALLRLAPEIREYILVMPEMVGRPTVSERALRPIVRIDDPSNQSMAFSKLAEHIEYGPRTGCSLRPIDH